MRLRKVWLSLLLALAMVITMLPAMAFAGEQDVITFTPADSRYAKNGTYVLPQTYGDMDDNGHWWFGIPPFADGDTLTINSVEYIYDEESEHFDNPHQASIDSDYVGKQLNQADKDGKWTEWVVGGEGYTLTVTYNGATCTVPVRIAEGSEPDDEEGNSFEDYNEDWVNADTISVGDTKTVDTNEADGLFKFIPEQDGIYVFSSAYEETEEDADPVGRVLDGSGNPIAEGDDVRAQGGDNNFEIYFNAKANQTYYLQAINCDGKAVFTVSLAASSADFTSISFTPVEPFEVIENKDGEYIYTEEGDSYFYYNYRFRNGDVLALDNVKYTYIDDYIEHKETYEEGDYIWYEGAFVHKYDEGLDDGVIYCDGDGGKFDIEDDQSLESPWSVGKHSFKIRYMGIETAAIPITVVKNPYTITYTPADGEFVKDGKYVFEEKTGGDEYSDYGDVSKEYYHYYCGYSVGDVFTVTDTRNSTTKTYVCAFDEETLHYFVNVADDTDRLYIDSGGTDGINFNNNQSYDHQWTPDTKDAALTCTYWGATCKIPVIIKESEATAKEKAVQNANTAINRANSLNASAYTASSYAAVTNAKNALAALLNNPAATSAQLKDATNALDNDINNLRPQINTVTVNVKTVNAAAINKAIAAAGGDKQYVTKVVLGAKVKKISKNAFKPFAKVTNLEVKTKKLTKNAVKGSLKGSKVSRINVKVGSKKVNKKFVKKYKKFFTKKNAGKKAAVK